MSSRRDFHFHLFEAFGGEKKGKGRKEGKKKPSCALATAA